VIGVQTVVTSSLSGTSSLPTANVWGQHSIVICPAETGPWPVILTVTQRGSGRARVWPLPVVALTCRAVVTFSIMTLSSVLHLQGQMDYPGTAVAVLRALVFGRQPAHATLESSQAAQLSVRACCTCCPVGARCPSRRA